MDRAVGYTAPCISFKGYNSKFTMSKSTFIGTTTLFEVYSNSMGGNVLLAGVNVTVETSKFSKTC